MRIYLDACCLNRPFDDWSQERTRQESEAVLTILQKIEAEEWSMVISNVLSAEVDAIPDDNRRTRVASLLKLGSDCLEAAESDLGRAETLEGLGFHGMDALHLAVAERASVDIFMTTDRQLLRCAERNRKGIGVPVENPVQWLMEVTDK